MNNNAVRFEIGDEGSAIGGGGRRSPRGRHLSCDGVGERQRRSSLRQHWDEMTRHDCRLVYLGDETRCPSSLEILILEDSGWIS